MFFLELGKLDELFQNKFEIKLYRDLTMTPSVTKLIDRFRSLDDITLKTLAKNLYKYCIERIDDRKLKKIVKRHSGEAKSISLLGQFLKENANNIDLSKYTDPLRALNKLRVYDSHLVSEDNEDMTLYHTLNVNRNEPHVWQGAEMIKEVANTFGRINSVIEHS